MYKLIGFDPTTKGIFEDEGKKIAYNNRLLKCITDNVADNFVGLDFCEFKLKLSELAKFFGCAETDEAVDTMLNTYLDWEFEPIYAIIKGKPTLNGLKFLDTPTVTPVKPMSDIVSEAKDKVVKK